MSDFESASFYTAFENFQDLNLETHALISIGQQYHLHHILLINNELIMYKSDIHPPWSFILDSTRIFIKKVESFSICLSNDRDYYFYFHPLHFNDWFRAFHSLLLNQTVWDLEIVIPQGRVKVQIHQNTTFADVRWMIQQEARDYWFSWRNFQKLNWIPPTMENQLVWGAELYCHNVLELRQPVHQSKDLSVEGELLQPPSSFESVLRVCMGEWQRYKTHYALLEGPFLFIIPLKVEEKGIHEALISQSNTMIDLHFVKQLEYDRTIRLDYSSTSTHSIVLHDGFRLILANGQVIKMKTMDNVSTLEWTRHLDQFMIYWKHKEKHDLFLRVTNKSSNLFLEEKDSARVIVDPHIWPICSRMKCCSTIIKYGTLQYVQSSGRLKDVYGLLTLNRFIVYPSIQTPIKRPFLSFHLKNHVFAMSGSPFSLQTLSSDTLFTLWTFSSHPFHQWIHDNVPFIQQHHAGHPHVFKAKWKEEKEEWLSFIHDGMI